MSDEWVARALDHIDVNHDNELTYVFLYKYINKMNNKHGKITGTRRKKTHILYIKKYHMLLETLNSKLLTGTRKSELENCNSKSE